MEFLQKQENEIDSSSHGEQTLPVVLVVNCERSSQTRLTTDVLKGTLKEIKRYNVERNGGEENRDEHHQTLQGSLRLFQASATSNGSVSICFSEHPVWLLTKYYSAQIALWEINASGAEILAFVEQQLSEDTSAILDVNEIASDNTECLKTRSTKRKVEGIISIYDQQSSSDFGQLEFWMRLSEVIGCELKVCIRISHPSVVHLDPAEQDLHFDKCLDYGFELIEVPDAALANGLAAAAAAGLEGGDGRPGHPGGGLLDDRGEKEGLARLVEALQATMWSSMVRSGGGSAGRRDARAARREGGREAGADEGARVAAEGSGGSSYRPPEVPPPSGDRGGGGGAELPAQRGLRAVPSSAAAAFEEGVGSGGERGAAPGGGGGAAPPVEEVLKQAERDLAEAENKMKGDGAHDGDSDDLAQIFEEVQRVRAAATAGRGLPDGARRAAAEGAALRLLGLLDLEEDEDEGEGEDG